MKNILNINKSIGISPFDVIKILKEKNPEYGDVSITYAGRLDPMAEGVLLLLVGDEVYKASEYQKLDKEYEAEILFGFETDTYDILGIPKSSHLVELSEEFKRIAKIEILKLKGEISLPFPPYSSYKIKGKPLFMWAKEGRVNDIKIPIQNTKIKDIKIVDFYEENKESLSLQITKKLKKVKGDFRQEEILKKWREVLSTKKGQKYQVAKVKFNVSSGTYIRSISHHLGNKLNTKAILLSLKRTKVGDFDIKDSMYL